MFLAPTQLATFILLLASLFIIVLSVSRGKISIGRSLGYAIWAVHASVFYIVLELNHYGVVSVSYMFLNGWSSAIRLHAVISFFAQVVLDRGGVVKWIPKT